MLVPDDVREALAREAALPSLADGPARRAHAGAPGSGAPSRAPPRFELAQIVRDHEAEYAAWCEREQGRVDPRVWKVFAAVRACRTPSLGGEVEVCRACGYARVKCRSCRDRHCPKCPGVRQARWLRQRDERALPVLHVHLVTTQPSQLGPLIRKNQRALYALLLRATADAIEDAVAARHGEGLRLAMTLVLHTYNRSLEQHHHVHAIVAAGGLASGDASGDAGQARWVTARAGECFLPADEVFADAYRARVLAGLERLRARGELELPGRLGRLRHPDAWATFVAGLARRRWHVYAKTTLRGGEAYTYLARYAGRVAMSNERILAYDGHTVTLATKAGHPPVVMSGVELLRRFALHILPHRFLRIRHYGLFNARQREHLARAREAIRAQGLELEDAPVDPVADDRDASADEHEHEHEHDAAAAGLVVAPPASSAITEISLGDAPLALAAVLALAVADTSTPSASAATAVTTPAASAGAGETWQQLVLRTQGKDVTRCPCCPDSVLARVDLAALDPETYSRVTGLARPPPGAARGGRRR